MSDASTALARLAHAVQQADPTKTYAIKGGLLVEAGAAGALPLAKVTSLLESTTDSTAEWDFLTLTVPTDLAAGAMFEAQFYGMQSQAAVSNILVLYAKVNGGTAFNIGSVGTGSTAQSFRSMLGRALFAFPTVGADGSFMVGGELVLNAIASQASNSAAPRAADTRAGMTITLGLRCTASNVANINRVVSGVIRQIA